MMVVSKVRKLVENASKEPSNTFGYSAWAYHIVSVVNFSKQLAKKLGADEEIAELAALLHDYASIVNRDWYAEHHIHGARLAREVLQKFSYPENKIAQVEHCILAHRGSRNIPRKTVEAKILADADALAHFTNIDALFHLALVSKKIEVEDATEFILAKLGRSWNKLSPEAKEICQPYYEAAKLLLEK